MLISEEEARGSWTSLLLWIGQKRPWYCGITTLNCQCAVCDHFRGLFCRSTVWHSQECWKYRGKSRHYCCFRYFSVIVFIYFNLVLNDSASLGMKIGIFKLFCPNTMNYIAYKARLSKWINVGPITDTQVGCLTKFKIACFWCWLIFLDTNVSLNQLHFYVA